MIFRKKKRYTLILNIDRNNGNIRESTYSNYKKIRYRYNKRKKCIKATLISQDARTIIHVANVIYVEKKVYYN